MALHPTISTPGGILDQPPTDKPARDAPEKAVRRAMIAKNIMHADGENHDSQIDLQALRALPAASIKELQEGLSEAGLYVGNGHKHHADGKIGPLTIHGLQSAASPSYALSEIGKSIADKELSRDELMRLQVSLNSLGYEAGDADGKMGRKTATALRSFLSENPDLNDDVSPGLRKAISAHAGPAGLKSAFTDATLPIPEAPRQRHDLPDQTRDGHSLLRPDMMKFLEQNPDRRAYFDMTREAATRHGLDPNMFANQIFQESKFDPEAKGPKTRFGTAQGIAQFLPGTAASVGVAARDLRNDDPKAVERVLEGSARHMADLKQNYGSQELAMVAYNGGGRAIHAVLDTVNARREKLGLEPQEKLTTEQWSAEMGARRAKLEARMEKQGRDPSDHRDYTKAERSTWHVQTYDYLRHANSRTWDAGKLERAIELPANKEQLSPPAAPPATKGPLVADAGAASKFSAAFAHAGSDANSDVKFSPGVAATVRSFLAPDFLKASFAPTPGDVAAAPAPKAKEPEMSPAPTLG